MPKAIQSKIREIEGLNRLLDENLLDAVWVLNADTLQYEYITPSVKNISGYTAEGLISQPIKDRVAPESLKTALSIFSTEKKRFDHGGKPIAVLELEMLHKNGSTYWVQIKAKFQKDTSGSTKIIGVTRDITERKKTEIEHSVIIGKLRKALEEKEQLLKEVKMLRELLPICSGCKRIRDENNRWWPLDAYVREHTKTDFTHTICPDCKDIFYEDL